MNTTNNTNALVQLEKYSANKPYINSTGTEVTFEVEYDDKFMNVTVEMEWCGRRDELTIVFVQAYCEDEYEKEVDVSGIDLESLVVEVFEKYNTFGEVEMAMEESYHAGHRG